MGSHLLNLTHEMTANNWNDNQISISLLFMHFLIINNKNSIVFKALYMWLKHKTLATNRPFHIVSMFW